MDRGGAAGLSTRRAAVKEATKFWLALIGGAASAAITVFGGDTTVGKCAAVVMFAVTAGAVYVARNGEAPAPTTPEVK
jgi:hypothetical protein